MGRELRHAAQSLVDALSIGLGRPVLLDDTALAPLAYSRQWDVDTVRSDSILSRGATPAVRAALLAQGIAEAREAVRTAPDAGLAMEGRVCLPVRDGEQVLGYLWLLDPAGDLTDGDLERLRQAARDLAGLLAVRPEVPDAAPLVAALRSPDPVAREGAAAEARQRGLLADGQVVLCLLAGLTAEAEPVAQARRAVRRLAAGHAVAATAPEGAALIVALGDPVLRTLPPDAVATWVQATDVAVGQSAAATLGALHEASRQAVVALRVARSRDPEAAAAWSALGADRLVAQLPAAALADVPAPLADLLRGEAALVETLAAFLDAGGDVKAAAAALSLHRSGLYYRLQRIEHLTDLDLSRGDDRLLAHLALRARRMP